MMEHRALPHGTGWFFNGQYFETKGACVAYMREHVPDMSWRSVAAAFPGGTKANCIASYNYFKQRQAVQEFRASKPKWT